MYYAIDLHTKNFLAGWRESEKLKRKRFLLTDKLSFQSFKDRLTKDDIVAVESTGNTYFFYDEIAPLVKEVKIINPTRFKVICESSSKSDKNDVKSILKFLEKDLLPEVPLPSKEVRELRGLFSTYDILKRAKTSCKNRITSLLNSLGIYIKSEDLFSKNGLKQITELSLDSCDQLQLEIMLRMIEKYEDEMKLLQDKICTYCFCFKEELELLTSIPGISVFVGLAILTDIGSIDNFKTAKKLCSYLGVVPKTKESNNKVRYGRINKKSRKLARTFLSQAIFHFINSSEYYKEFYYDKKKSRGSGKAIIASMRRMIVIIYHMLKNRTAYRYAREQLHKKKLSEMLKIIEKLKKLNTQEFDLMEHRARMKYDDDYREKIIKGNQNIA